MKLSTRRRVNKRLPLEMEQWLPTHLLAYKVLLAPTREELRTQVMVSDTHRCRERPGLANGFEFYRTVRSALQSGWSQVWDVLCREESTTLLGLHTRLVFS